MNFEIDKILKSLSIEEKCALLSGKGLWETRDIPSFNFPSVMMCDGPHGLGKRKAGTDHTQIDSSTVAVCFPTGAALASSFDEKIFAAVAKCLAEAAISENVHTVLGPAINIKRSPLCGRNFEYLSEDPYLTGKLATAYVQAMQAESVGVSVKHFAVNNQETYRLSISANLSERALREIYLPAFEMVVKESKPWAIMASYNLINGIYSTNNKYLLKEILRDEWGFDGIVMSDWGAQNDKLKSLVSGLNLEMPESHSGESAIVEAIRSGEVSEELLDLRVAEILQWINKGRDPRVEEPAYDKEAQHNFARYAETESAVLLKNENAILPLTSDENVLFLGTYAEKPRFQGGGSSLIRSYRVSSALDSLPENARVKYLPAWSDDAIERDEKRLEEALETAKYFDKVIVFAGLPDSFEIEGKDRLVLDMPKCQNELIEELAAIHENIVVVLHKGSPTTMPWKEKVKAILDMYLGGEAVGEATVDLLYGEVSPSGKLAETYPLRIEDTPAFGNWPGTAKSVQYHEDIYVGYRWYDLRKMDVLFPFGHGLSYSEFNYTDIKVQDLDKGEFEISCVIENTGKVSAKEVVQLYVAPKDISKFPRAIQELKAFRKIELIPGQRQELSFTLDKRSFALFNEEISDWYVPAGEYEILIGSSSRDIRLSKKITLQGDPIYLSLSDQSTLLDVVLSGNFDKIKEDYFKMCRDSRDESFLQRLKFIDENQDKIINGEIEAGDIDLPLHFYQSYWHLDDEFIKRVYDKLQ